MDRVHLNLAIYDDVQKIRRVAFTRQFHIDRKALEERFPQHFFDVSGTNAGEQRQRTHFLDFVHAHGWLYLPSALSQRYETFV